MTSKKFQLLTLLSGSFVLLLSCSSQETITIFHAGSLSPLIDEVAERYQKNHPGIVVYREASGSLDAIRKVTELGRRGDLLATADSRLIERFLIPEHASTLYEFLGNELVLATAKRSLAPGSSPTLWYERLLAKESSYGISSPDRDPAGYYAHLTWKLAEVYHERPGLYRRLLRGLDPRWIRPKSSELVALLETKSLDFAFLYKSAALQNDLLFIDLPAQVSLGESSYADLYSRVFTHVTGDHPGSSVEIAGAPIRYGICLLNGAGPKARGFLDFLLSQEVRQLYRELGFKVVPIVKSE